MEQSNTTFDTCLRTCVLFKKVSVCFTYFGIPRRAKRRTRSLHITQRTPTGFILFVPCRVDICSAFGMSGEALHFAYAGVIPQTSINKWGATDGKGLQQARPTSPPCWYSKSSKWALATSWRDMPLSLLRWRCWRRLRKHGLGNLEILATSGRFLFGKCLMKISPWRIYWSKICMGRQMTRALRCLTCSYPNSYTMMILDNKPIWKDTQGASYFRTETAPEWSDIIRNHFVPTTGGEIANGVLHFTGG